MTAQEYEQLIEIATQNQNSEIGTWLAAFNAFQYNLIARVDDTSKWRAPDLQPFDEFENYGITARLCWSKNVMEERDAPTQILFGAMDWRYCTLSNLAPWLEYHFTLNPEENDYFFGIQGNSDPTSIKTLAAYHLRDVLQDDEFSPFADGLMGTHSLRKFAVTVARRNGCSKDDTDHRGRWKSGSRQQDTYADTTIPYVDAKVAAALCKGGPISFLVKEESGITDQWILDYVVPATAHHLPRQACVVLGRALLWKIFHVSGEALPNEIRSRVFAAYNNLADHTLQAGENPVRKIPLGVAGIDSELIIDEIMGEDNGTGGNNGGNHRANQGFQRQEVRLLSAQVLHLRRELTDSRAELERRDANFQRKLSRINTNVACIAAAPVRRSVATAGTGSGGLEAGEGNGDQGEGQGEGGREAEGGVGGGGEPTRRRLVPTLSSRPKTLHDLWKEYVVGMSGKKAAREFSDSERGKVKSVYSFRLKFWKKCDEMVRSGLTADIACDKIYQAYGVKTSVTKILTAMKRDKRDGTWPASLQELLG